MTKLVFAAAILLSASAATASDTRQLEAHEHGVGQMDIAIDGGKIAIELHAPGADIVGFEYAAQSAEDRAKIDAAVATLARPLDLFVLPADAGCSVVQASASLESEEDHDADHDSDHEMHEDEEHAEDEHDHEDEHDDDHDEKDHAAHEDEDEHDHDEHADAAGHTEFHAEYLLNCNAPSKASLITFAYFDTFPNALELEVQVISDKGATAYEVERDAPPLDLRNMF